MGKTTHEYMKARQRARDRLKKVGHPADFIVDRPPAKPKAQVVNRWRRSYKDMFRQGYVPISVELIDSGLNTSLLPTKIGPNDPDDSSSLGRRVMGERPWMPAWVAALCLFDLSVPELNAKVLEVVDNPRLQLLLCGQVLLAQQLDDDHRTALRAWVEKVRALRKLRTDQA